MSEQTMNLLGFIKGFNAEFDVVVNLSRQDYFTTNVNLVLFGRFPL